MRTVYAYDSGRCSAFAIARKMSLTTSYCLVSDRPSTLPNGGKDMN